MEKIERQSSSEELLKQYDLRFSDKQEITFKEHACLLHGSRNLIPFEEGIVSSSREKIFATNNASVAIIKAIFSAKGLRNLGYHLGGSGEQSVTIEGEPTQGTVGEKGYVYVVSDVEGFSNDGTQGRTEFTKSAKKGEAVHYSKMIEVEKRDFNYPIDFVK